MTDLDRSTPLVTMQDLVKKYHIKTSNKFTFFSKTEELTALNSVSLSIERSKTLAVIGESGCGKSTLARQVAMLETPDSGSFTFDGVEVTKANKAKKRSLQRKLQFIFQNPYTSLNPRKNLRTTILEPLKINRKDLSAAEQEDKLDYILETVGILPSYKNRYPHMLSGGQRQRIAIARALMLDPTLIIADEPVSALDVSIQAQVLNLLVKLQEEFHVSYLFISHDLSVVKHIAENILIMYLGHVIEYGARETIFSNPLHPYTKALISAIPSIYTQNNNRIILKGDLPSPLAVMRGCPFANRCVHVKQECKEAKPKLTHTISHLVACHFAKELA